MRLAHLVLPLAAAACGAVEPLPDAASPPRLDEIYPAVADPLGGSRLHLRGAGLAAATEVRIGGVLVARVDAIADDEVQVVTAALPPGDGLDVEVDVAGATVRLTGAVDAWSPAELPGARLFDAATGVTSTEAARTYEWQRLATATAPAWRARDGNTLDWLPATGRLWMVGGWNPYAVPDGFDDVDPASGEPPRTTTSEVWSSPDGVSWTLERDDADPAFDRRHAHNTVRWRDRLWMIGGDWWRGAYNHDVVSSADGRAWTVELAQTPWADRALLVAGVHDDQLWVVGGQDLDGTPRDEFVYHNDVWRSADGVTWEQVAADAPPSETRWSGRGAVGELASFRGRLWLVGGAQYRDDAVGNTYFAEVWSTTDGASWTQHAAPPWAGRIWHDVRVWDDRLWVLFGGNDSGNLADAWYSDDGETWTAIDAERSHAPGSHAQGVAELDDALVLAGGNHSFGVGPTPQDTDESVWRLQAFRGDAVDAWTDRGGDAVVVTATGAARPVRDPDGLGDGIPGVQFDGASHFLTLASPELQPAGRSVLWVGRAAWSPAPADWTTPPRLSPLFTVVGDGDAQACAAGLGDGGMSYTSAGAAGWVGVEVGDGLRVGPGEVRFAGVTHAADGAIQGWIDGAAAGAPADGGYSELHGWSRIGAAGYGPVGDRAFGGTLGAVVILPYAADAATVARVHAWAQGRFGAP